MESGSFPVSGATDHSSESGLAVNDDNCSDRIRGTEIPRFDLDESLDDSARSPKRRRDDNASEEVAVMDLLNSVMNSNILPRTTPSSLLNVLMASDKCTRYCSQLLRNLPMTCESALLYLDTIPSTSLNGDPIQPLIDAAKNFLASHFKYISKFKEEILNLPLAGIEAVLSSDDLQVYSENAVYDLVMKWARTHYPKLKERRRILRTSLLGLIRFPCMTDIKLNRVLNCKAIGPKLASKIVRDAVSFKTRGESSSSLKHRNRISLVGAHRLYKYHPVKVVEFEEPCQECIVYLEIKRANPYFIANPGRVYTHDFEFGGQRFRLSTVCNSDGKTPLVVALGMRKKGSEEEHDELTVEYEFGLGREEEFVSKARTTTATFTGGKVYGCRTLVRVPWAAFIADDSPYFINGILHLRARLTLIK
ncbi:hypothetical protein ACJIZ3_005077 [Penstemon smallii]|uniref:BACK domain-containing protein n=1 Tax=Penstemon smallii TaxID=265156 RepID=A0ABD3S429_9LAMI